jgi:hypothetical protein
MKSLVAYFYDDRTQYGSSDARDELEASDEYISMFGTWIRDTVELLETIEEKTWFTRTWTFQEKHCASSLQFLVPIAQFTEISDVSQSHVIETDH